MFDQPYPKQGEFNFQDVMKQHKTTKRTHNDSSDNNSGVDLNDSVVDRDFMGSPPPAKVARPGTSKDFMQSMPGTSKSSLIQHLKKRDSTGTVTLLFGNFIGSSTQPIIAWHDIVFFQK